MQKPKRPAKCVPLAVHRTCLRCVERMLERRQLRKYNNYCRYEGTVLRVCSALVALECIKHGITTRQERSALQTPCAELLLPRPSLSPAKSWWSPGQDVPRICGTFHRRAGRARSTPKSVFGAPFGRGRRRLRSTAVERLDDWDGKRGRRT